MAPSFTRRARTGTDWLHRIPEGEARLYRQGIEFASDLQIPFALGGTFASASYTGYWRDTKDLDLYVLQRDCERLLEAVSSLGFTDCYWKGSRCLLVDLPLHSGRRDRGSDRGPRRTTAQIDELWLSGLCVEVYGRQVRVLPAEAVPPPKRNGVSPGTGATASSPRSCVNQVE